MLPGAFNTTTGPLHWELLQKARAVDNQLFVATCSPARNSEASYQAWGHSTAIDPFGKVNWTLLALLDCDDVGRYVGESVSWLLAHGQQCSCIDRSSTQADFDECK